MRISGQHFQVPGERFSELAIATHLRRVLRQIPNLKRNLTIARKRLPERHLILNRVSAENDEHRRFSGKQRGVWFQNLRRNAADNAASRKTFCHHGAGADDRAVPELDIF